MAYTLEERKERHNNASREHRIRLRLKALERYGQVCFCCGEYRVLFLSIDHVNGNGNQHRREVSCKLGGYPFLRWLANNDWPDGFRTACHNCNQGMSINNGVCPHESERMGYPVRGASAWTKRQDTLVKKSGSEQEVEAEI